MRDADALLASLKQPVAVVGNGWMRHKHGPIEVHPTVIRFNNYHDVLYEPHVGHTINVWCVTCCGNVRPRRFPHPVDVMTIATLREQPIDVPRWLETYPDMAVPGESWIVPARKFKGCNPTTGLTLLLRMLTMGIRFTAFGFDGCRSGHYWDKLHRHTDSHGDEFPALLKLMRMGANIA